MNEQIAVDTNVVKFLQHKTQNVYGPLLKWVPPALLKALRMYSQLPMRDNPFFLTPHTNAEKVEVAKLLVTASTVLGQPGAVPSSNFIRKLFATKVSAGSVVSEQTWKAAVEDLAAIDAHSVAMAQSSHYDVSDMMKSAIVTKSLKAFVSIMGSPPQEYTEDFLELDQFHLKYPSKVRKRRGRWAETDEEREELEARVHEIGNAVLAAANAVAYRNGMFKQVVNRLRDIGIDCSYGRVRCILKGA